MKRYMLACVLLALTGAGWVKWNHRTACGPRRGVEVSAKCGDQRLIEPPEAYRGPIKRQQPVGWVFGRLVGVDAKLMSPYRPAGP